MWSAIASAIASLLATLFGRKKAQEDRKNSPEMVANVKANDEQKRQDEIETQIIKAQNGDEKALEDLRRASAE